MSTQHTKGPWKVKAGSNAVLAGRKQICSHVNAASVLPVNIVEDQKIAEANARLIAAAPDLLDELKKLRRAYVSLLETGRDRIIQYGGQCDSVEAMEAADPYLKSSRAAIAKATGETK